MDLAGQTAEIFIEPSIESFIEPRILVIRGHRVLLDRDLAKLYQVKPIALRQCNPESEIFKGGTIVPQVFGFCVVKLTKRRIGDIKDAYLSNR